MYWTDGSSVGTSLVNPAQATRAAHTHPRSRVVVRLLAGPQAVIVRYLGRKGDQPPRFSRDCRRPMALHPGRAREASDAATDEVFENRPLGGGKFVWHQAAGYRPACTTRIEGQSMHVQEHADLRDRETCC